eukprot:2100133-Pyramimonas_sp.AAC.1
MVRKLDCTTWVTLPSLHHADCSTYIANHIEYTTSLAHQTCMAQHRSHNIYCTTQLAPHGLLKKCAQPIVHNKDCTTYCPSQKSHTVDSAT